LKEQENSDNTSLYYTGDSAFAPVPMHIGSPPIKPIDKGLIKANAYEAMRHHANQQVDMLRKQAELLMEQVREIEKRVDISRQIYESDIRFVPEVGNTYYLYEHNGMHKLSMVGPNEWGRSKKFDNYIATVKLLADKTWDVIDSVAIKNA
jgi:hypothetical protein